ncbi:glutamate receptor 2.7-like [Iris pallida]|uniref:Glutamate receptor 2.7-like n=1 Tax=Iris pallida TaxID=29817 RepID=A0AAX6DVS8_IRIPA|nr:glutamate receptor 2.7-like [Iris pallida]
MLMALEDFYEAHPGYTTNLALHLRDTDRSTVGAANAAVDLLKNVPVQAIIGPQTSAQAKFIIELGGKTHVPIITFSAKSSSLSSQRSPYFVRAAMNDYSQTEVIASIVQFFKWREVVPIFEDGGSGIIHPLVDALQAVGARVPYRSSLPPSATKDQIMKELEQLKSMRTRVFVVQMSYDSGFRLFSHAEEAGMMREGYVWIATYGLIDLVDLNGSSATKVMQGVLGVKPYVRETKKLHNFKLRWRKRFQQEYSAQVDELPTVFGCGHMTLSGHLHWLWRMLPDI